MDRKVKGYTVMEVLVVMAIVATLGGFAFIGLRNLILNQRLKATTDNLVSVLNTARINSMTGRDVKNMQGSRPWGVSVETNSYILFEDTNFNCRYDNGENVKTFRVEGGVRVNNPLVLVFDKKGYPRNALCGFGVNNIVVNSESGKVKTICISRYGRIRVVEGSTCPQE
ncbi:MAG: prepilin-type N-terminal cleavage/methylation domain-containing protein [Aquificaceae bacterium]